MSHLPRLRRAGGADTPQIKIRNLRSNDIVTLLAPPETFLTHFDGRTLGCEDPPENCPLCRRLAAGEGGLKLQAKIYAPAMQTAPGIPWHRIILSIPLSSAELFKADDVGQVL